MVIIIIININRNVDTIARQRQNTFSPIDAHVPIVRVRQSHAVIFVGHQVIAGREMGRRSEIFNKKKTLNHRYDYLKQSMSFVSRSVYYMCASINACIRFVPEIILSNRVVRDFCVLSKAIPTEVRSLLRLLLHSNQPPLNPPLTDDSVSPSCRVHTTQVNPSSNVRKKTYSSGMGKRERLISSVVLALPTRITGNGNRYKRALNRNTLYAFISSFVLI